MYKNYIYTFYNNKIQIVGEFVSADIIDKTIVLHKGLIEPDLLYVDNNREVSIVLEATEGRIEYQNIKLDSIKSNTIKGGASRIVVANLSLDITNIEPKTFPESASAFYLTFNKPNEESNQQYYGFTEAPGIY
jgi:hypothetical protein